MRQGAFIVDRARAHTSKKVKAVLKKNKNIMVFYLPKGSPYLNAIEKLWDLVKHAVLTSEYYSTFDDMWDALVKCFRTLACTLIPRKYLFRNPAPHCTN